MIYYDGKNKKLIILSQKADPKYWDKHWDNTDNFIDKIRVGRNNRFIKKFTEKFLPKETKIIEAGCGIGQNVYGLKEWGYDSYGVDFAQNTIERAKKEFPCLNLSVQDVRKLNFPESFFDGYWSLGVIEHFWNGYEEILSEATRLIKPNGYLFLTFPYMNPLRRLKVKLKLYNLYKSDQCPDNFYQFILDSQKVKTNIEKYGFKLVLKYPFDAIDGLKDTVNSLVPILQIIYLGNNVIAKLIKLLISILFSNIAGHAVLLVFKKQGNINKFKV